MGSRARWWVVRAEPWWIAAARGRGYLGGPSTLMGCRRATGPGRKLLQCLAILKLDEALTLVLGSRVYVALEAVHR